MSDVVAELAADRGQELFDLARRIHGGEHFEKSQLDAALRAGGWSVKELEVAIDRVRQLAEIEALRREIVDEQAAAAKIENGKAAALATVGRINKKVEEFAAQFKTEMEAALAVINEADYLNRSARARMASARVELNVLLHAHRRYAASQRPTVTDDDVAAGLRSGSSFEGQYC